MSLLEGQRVLDRIALEQPVCGPARPTSVSLSLGADRDAKAWNTESDKCDMDLAARTVKMDTNTTALLVTRLMGSEYRYRSHRLYAARSGKLNELWSYHDDFSGADWTRTAVVPGAAGSEDVAFVDVARDDDAVTRQITAQRLHLDPASGRLAQRTLPDAIAPLFLLQVGRFKRAEETSARPDCLRELVIMRRRVFPSLTVPPFFLGAVFARHDEAVAAEAAARTCAPGTEARILEIASRKGKRDAQHH